MPSKQKIKYVVLSGNFIDHQPLLQKNIFKLTKKLSYDVVISFAQKWLHISDQLFNFFSFFLKEVARVGSKPGSSRFHLFSHFHHFTTEPQRLPNQLNNFELWKS
jgi:hypothetical protein